MENYEHTQTVRPGAPELEETADTSRRGFLHRIAAAGMGSAALAMLAGLGGKRRAEAQTSPTLQTLFNYTIEMDTRQVRIYPEGSPQMALSAILEGIPPFARVLAVPLLKAGNFDPRKAGVYGVWWTPYNDIHNLLAFRTIDVIVKDYGGEGRLNWIIAPGPCVTTATLTVSVNLLYLPG
jgi:hypothetical protein